MFYLAIALVFMQGARLHVHIYDHDPATFDHGHQEQAHLSYDALEPGHPDTVMEIDLSHQGFLKNFSFASLVVAFFSAAMIILSPRLLTRVPWPHNQRGPLTSRLFNLRPPLRAPPL